MDKLFSTKVIDNYLMDDNGIVASDDDYSREINHSNDEDNSESDEAPVEYKGKRLSNQNGETFETRRNPGKYYAKQKLQRQPTRRPDPRVSNRNALMARENRRRKKELIHQMENQINDVSKENKYLKKLVKQQGLTISKLNNEKLYYKSIITNRTEIIKLLQVIGKSDIPVQYSEKCVKNKQDINESDCIDSSTDGENDLECETPSSSLSEDFGDSACGLNGWDNLLNFNDLMPIFSESSELENKPLDIRSEHNYTYTDNELVKPGVCIHVSSGRVSLEFCASCHNRAQDAYLLD